MKKVLLCLLLPLIGVIYSYAETFLLDVGIEQFIAVPDVPYGVVDKAIWSCDVANVTFVEKNNSGARVKITSYFDNAATVSLLYVVKYYDNKGFTRSYTGIKYFSVQCKGTAPMIVPSGITLKKGETYQLHITPSSYESQAVWSDWTGSIATNVNSSGMVTAKKNGEGIVFATLPNMETPLTCLVYVKDTQLSINANVSSGMVENGTEVTLTASKSSAKIYYTLDGSSPEMNGDLYIAPIPITGDVTLKAVASDENYESSNLLTRTYTVLNTDEAVLENAIYINDITAFVGDELTLTIKMKNSVPIHRFQFNLCLPAGVSAIKNTKDRIQVALSVNRLEEDDEHTISATEQSDGSILVFCSSQYEECFTGNDGEIATIKLKVDENIKKGNYSIMLKNIKLTSGDNSSYETSNYTSTFTVFEYMLGDVNGNQIVDINDYIDIANHIHGNIQDGFIEKNADVDGNGIIDISDYIGVANLIHTGSIYGDVLIADITTNEASNIGEKSATLNGLLTVTSATKPYTVGFFVTSEGTPSNENYIKKLESGSNNKGNFSSTISDLDYSTTYYYCAYILYEGVYYYGETKSFTTTKKTTYAIGDLYPNDENPIGFVYALSTDNYGKSGWIASLESAYLTWEGAKSWAFRYNGYSGWTLPSKSELQKIARNINLFKQRNLISPFTFWSSNEDVMSSGALYSYAYVVDLSSGSTYSRRADKSYHVVAIRPF